MIQLKVKKVSVAAKIPEAATAGAACFDLSADFSRDEAFEKTSVENMVIPTGLAFEVPPGYAMMVYSRSGQGFNNNTRLANCVGIIDSDYRGEVMVKLTRDDGEPITVKHGERVAQAMIIPVPVVEILEVDALSSTARGEGGLGSTGK